MAARRSSSVVARALGLAAPTPKTCPAAHSTPPPPASSVRRLPPRTAAPGGRAPTDVKCHGGALVGGAHLLHPCVASRTTTRCSSASKRERPRNKREYAARREQPSAAATSTIESCKISYSQNTSRCEGGRRRNACCPTASTWSSSSVPAATGRLSVTRSCGGAVCVQRARATRVKVE